MMSIDPAQLSNMLGMAGPIVKTQVDNKIATTIATLENKLDRKLTPPVVLYDLKGTTAGQAIVNQAEGTQTIRLNLPALNNPEFRDYMLNQTIPHEVAHLVEYQLYGTTGHGWKWQRLMHLLDLPANRTHSLPLPKARKTQKWAYRCNCKVHYVSTTRHNRIERGQQTYYCKTCKGELR